MKLGVYVLNVFDHLATELQSAGGWGCSFKGSFLDNLRAPFVEREIYVQACSS